MDMLGKGRFEGTKQTRDGEIVAAFEGAAEALSAAQVSEVVSCLRAVARSYEALQAQGHKVEPPETTVADLLALSNLFERSFQVIVLAPPLDPRRN